MFNTFMYSVTYSCTAMPHEHVTQRQDPHTGKCLDIQLYNIFLTGDGCFQTLAVIGRLLEHDAETRSSLSLAKIVHVCCLDSGVTTRSVRFGSQGVDENISLILEDRNQWIELVDLNISASVVASRCDQDLSWS